MLDREKVIKGLECCISDFGCFECPYITGSCQLDCKRDALELLKEQVPIVRCKDCKWYDERISMCDNCESPREQTFFCADGRQR